jgi:hypothetical protein
MLVGPPGVGKSTTALRLARETGCALVGEDQIIVRDGQLYSYDHTSYLHRKSPLLERLIDSGEHQPSLVSTLARQIDSVDQSLLPRPVHQLLCRLARISPRVAFDPGEVAPLVETASLGTCLLLHPGDGSPSIRPITPGTAADRIAVLNDWRYQRTDVFSTVARYLTGDTAPEGEAGSNPRTPEAIRAALDGCDCYEVRAPPGQQFAVIKRRFEA